MEETLNYGLRKPDLTDPVDVRVLNENFDKIDEELTNFYDIFKDGDFVPSFDLTVDLEEVDVTEYLNQEEMSTAVNSGKILRIWFTRTDTDNVCSAALTDIYDSEIYQNTYYCGLFSHPFYNASYGEFVLIYYKETGVFTLRRYGNFPKRFFNNTKEDIVALIEETADSTAKVTAVHTAINGDTYTMTLTLDDGTTSVNVITVTDGYPSSVVADGVEIPFTWEEVTTDG